MSNICKTTAVLLIIAVYILTAACAEGTDPALKVADTAETAVTTEAVTEMKANIPDNLDYAGYTYTFLISGNIENDRQKNDFYSDAETGEPVNDARFIRNTKIEDLLGINIETVEQYGSDAGYNALLKSVTASDFSYDTAMLCGYATCKLASNGYLYDINSLQYVDLSQPWWDQKATGDLSIKGRLFYTTGDISTADNDGTCTILFNKKLVTDHNLSDPYSLVNTGKWTVDVFGEMSKAVSTDLNGDGKYDKNDQFGIMIWDDTMMGIVNGIGEKCATINADGELELTLYNTRVLTMFDKFTAIVYDKSVAYAYQRVSYDITDPVNMFSGNQVLFFMQLLDLVTYFRDMETDFGIIPFPKLDETQDGYAHTIGSWHSVFLCVPSVLEDAERTGIVLEAMACESLKTVTPAYYEKTLVGKLVRDDESAEMLDIILSTRVYDAGWYYQFGGYNEQIMNLFRSYKSDFTSMYQKYEPAAIKAIEKVNAAFAESLTDA
ncbi:MAG: hypothetical protein ACYCWE_09920 [Eubacteriales bacterium]